MIYIWGGGVSFCLRGLIRRPGIASVIWLRTYLKHFGAVYPRVVQPTETPPPGTQHLGPR